MLKFVHTLSLVLLMVVSLMAPPAQASTCSLVNGSTLQPMSPVVASPVIQGSITVGRDIPIGTILYKSTYWGSAAIPAYKCDVGGTGYLSYEINTAPSYGLSTWVAPNGAKVYLTHIAGIGVYASNETPGNTGGGIPWTGSGFSLAGGGVTGFMDPTGNATMTSFVLNVVKISNTVGTGTLTSADFPTVKYYFNSTNRFPYLQSNAVAGSVVVVAGTCTTPDVYVDMGSHAVSELTGIRTGTAWVNFSAQLTNCPAFFGYNQYRVYPFAGTSTASSLASNAINFTIQAVAGWSAGADLGVLLLQPDGVHPTATGIGIQLAMGSNGANVINQNAYPLGSVSVTATPQNYSINMSARYIQTNSTTAAGQANGAATITLIYL
ncbi:fimbrial protein [Dyella amyloliquefaciens]|uniref:fimbrial protein n=1 Tax=Dyella amyloliquefaciens TaxID=1770545 RepID=UPI0013EE64FD|nr:fimbrial protein [Dyella amyloliquefaciens]